MTVKIKPKKNAKKRTAMDNFTDMLKEGPAFKILAPYSDKLSMIATQQARKQYEDFIAPIIKVLEGKA